MRIAGHDDDPISAASTGLLALGVGPQRRMETLGLLAALLDLADEGGEVLLDGELITTEERLGIDLCLEGYEWLEQLDVLRRTWSGWVIVNFDAHGGPAGATAASIAVLHRHANAFEEAEPVAVTPLRRRRRLAVVAASVAAGIAVFAGAAQLVPQAAVSTRNAAVRADGSVTSQAGAVVSAVPQTPVATGPSATHAPSEPATAITTTTSTTILPSVPCLADVLRGLTRGAGLRQTGDQLPPALLPCP